MPPEEHLVELDADKTGVAVMCNRLAGHAKGEWLLPLADDDLLDADYLETMVPQLKADVVWSWCRFTDRNHELATNRLPPKNIPEALKQGNFIPGTALIRKTLWDLLGGYREVPYEDWDLWRRAANAGASFHCVPEVLWTFRLHANNTFTR